MLTQTLDTAVAEFGAQTDAARRDPRSAPFGWGVEFLDRELGPVIPGHVYVVGARTSVGKTFFALHVVSASSVPALFVSLEDSLSELGRRAAQIPPSRRAEVLVSTPVRPRLSAVLEAIRASSGVRLVVVDYIQLIQYDGNVDAWSKMDQVRQILIELKALSRERGFATVITSQLRRPGVSVDGSSSEPTLYELRDASDIENSAEVVILLHALNSNQIRVKVAKSKSTPSGGKALFRRAQDGFLEEVSVNDSSDDSDPFAL